MSIEDIKKGLDAIGYVISDGAQVQIAKDILIEAVKQAKQQEPVAWYDPEVMHEDRGISWTHGQFHTAPLYTAPPQRQSLTDEEIFDIAKIDARFEFSNDDIERCSQLAGVIDLARAIEAAHGINEKES
jgi:hypothetical protein